MKYWCANFENEKNLEHGLTNICWSMGYQCSDSDPPSRKAAITSNWRLLLKVKEGDKFVAYLKESRFFAIGTVVRPRRKRTSSDVLDSIEEYLARKEAYSKGFIYFSDCQVAYENFDDRAGWPVRIDVDSWTKQNLNGVHLKVIGNIPVHKKTRTIFEISKTIFQKIETELMSNTAKDPPIKTKVEPRVNKSKIVTKKRADAQQWRNQGYILDSKLRKKIELYAMKKAEKYFESEGFVVEDCSTTRPFDLSCTKGKLRKYVEVKGTQGTGESIFLTSGEVDFARKNKKQMILFIVHSINASNGNSLRNGVDQILSPWDVDKGTLKSKMFQYKLP